jgi:hypothetical protein
MADYLSFGYATVPPVIGFLAFIVKSIFVEQVENKNNCFIFCTNYGQAGAINIIGGKYGLSEPVSFSESFKY